MSGWFGIAGFHLVISGWTINIEESMGFHSADVLAVEGYHREKLCWHRDGAIEINTAIAWREGWNGSLGLVRLRFSRASSQQNGGCDEGKGNSGVPAQP